MLYLFARFNYSLCRYNTDILTNRVFYTDNGLEIRERKADGPRTEVHYYPNLAVAYLQDPKKDVQFTVCY